MSSHRGMGTLHNEDTTPSMSLETQTAETGGADLVIGTTVQAEATGGGVSCGAGVQTEVKIREQNWLA